MLKTSFFIWEYRFYEDRVEIFRDFVLTRTNVIYADKIEMVVMETDIIFHNLGRCNLLLTFAGNIFTLIGVPVEVADAFCRQVTNRQNLRSGQVKRTAPSDPNSPSPPLESKANRITISNTDLLKKSLLQTKLIWYIVIVVALWAAVILMGSNWITSELAHTISDFVFRHMITAGTLVLSLGLPSAIIWLWAFTGGFLVEFIKYYKYTATRIDHVLCFEYGLLIHRRVYLSTDRIAITGYSQTPIMRACGYGKLEVRAVGYNTVFLKSQPILPFLKVKQMPEALTLLLPEIDQTNHAPCRRSLGYDFVSWKCLLPVICLILSAILGYAWLIAAAVVLTLVICSILLEYQNTDFAVHGNLTVLSKGGFYRSTAWIYNERIELIALSGSRRKKRKGFTNVRLKVFGKSGNFALVRNIGVEAVEKFRIPDRDIPKNDA